MNLDLLFVHNILDWKIQLRLKMISKVYYENINTSSILNIPEEEHEILYNSMLFHLTGLLTLDLNRRIMDCGLMQLTHPNITNNGLKHLTNLKALHISHNWKINNAALDNLENLDYWNAYKVPGIRSNYIPKFRRKKFLDC